MVDRAERVADRHTFGTPPSHTRDDFPATLKTGGKGPKGPGGKWFHARGREHVRPGAAEVVN
jgi:hypothetical protein